MPPSLASKKQALADKVSPALASKKKAIAGKLREANEKRQKPAAHEESEILSHPNTLDENYESAPPHRKEEDRPRESQSPKTLESHPLSDLEEPSGKARRGEKCGTKNCEWRLWARQAKLDKAKDQKKMQMLEKKVQFLDGKLRKMMETVQKQRQEIDKLRMNNKGENMRMKMEGKSMLRQEKSMDKQQLRDYNLAMRAMKTPEELEAEMENRQANIQMGIRAGASMLRFGSEVYRENKQQNMGRPGPGNQGQHLGPRRPGQGNMQNAQHPRPNQMQISGRENMHGNMRGPPNRQQGVPRGPGGDNGMGRPRGPAGPGRGQGPGGPIRPMGQGGMGRSRGPPGRGQGQGGPRGIMGQGEERRSMGLPDTDMEEGQGVEGQGRPRRPMGPSEGESLRRRSSQNAERGPRRPIGSSDGEGLGRRSSQNAERGPRRPPGSGPGRPRGPPRQHGGGDNLRRSPRRAQTGDEENEGGEQTQQNTSPRHQKRTSQDEPLQPMTPPANNQTSETSAPRDTKHDDAN